jgi:hypothetical protein
MVARGIENTRIACGLAARAARRAGWRDRLHIGKFSMRDCARGRISPRRESWFSGKRASRGDAGRDETSFAASAERGPIMSLQEAKLPPGFSWLRGVERPSDQEVDTYAHLIANAEGYPPESMAERLHAEAELQLWTWRAENRTRPPAQRRRLTRSRHQPADEENASSAAAG